MFVRLIGLIQLLLSKKHIFLYVLPIIAFLIGLLLPSPFFSPKNLEKKEQQYTLAEINGLIVDEENRYDGTVIEGTKTRQGFGRLTTTDGTVYEGNWQNNRLGYGQRTTTSSVYRGHFDKKLNNDGFGIVEYSDKYIAGKRRQGIPDNQIVKKYIGNWHRNAKQGLGRAVNIDGSMQFGMYRNGTLQNNQNTNFRIGGSVYGIDLSHYQTNVDWDNLALYCDKNGNVYHGKPKEKKYMQPVFFAYLKATEGATIKDATYSIRTIEAERHGIIKGAYHFLHLGSSVDEQVKNFVETTNWMEGDLPPALDIEVESEIKEYGKKRLVKMALGWLEKIESTMHVRPIIYTRESIRNRYLNDNRLRKYDFWIARYSNRGPNNFDWHLWQKTDKGVLEGYDAGRIDINLFKGDYTSFIKYINKVKQ